MITRKNPPGRSKPLPDLRPLLAGILLLAVLPAHSALLSLSEAEQRALEKDPVVGATEIRAEALEEDAVADAQLPDPKLRTGLYNVPLDDFDIDREPTTQFRVGIQQAFPRGDTLVQKAGKTRAEAEVERARARLERNRILRDVRTTFLDLYFQVESARIVDASRSLFENLVEITQVQYGSGGSSQQDVLRAELELSRLDDRLSRIRTREEQARARLSRWLGELAWRPLRRELPDLTVPPATGEIEAKLDRHPEIAVRSAIIETHQRMVNISREQYKPGWALGAEYRKRFGDNPDGSDRADMAAVMLTVDLPLFTAKRQDKRLAASQKRANAAYLDRDNSYRKLREQLASALATRKRLEERIARYESRLLREAEENATAALLAYQSGTTEFTGLMRARITELDIRLQALKLRVELLKTRANLLYLYSGEEQ